MEWLGKDNLTRTSIQIAAEARWEDAVSVEQTDIDALRRWFVDAGPNVAIEGVYCDEARNFVGFFGFRRIIEDADQRISFWLSVIAASKAYQMQAPCHQLAAWLSLMGVPSPFSSAPAGTQLGVFNQWLSAGPVNLNDGRLERQDVNAGPAWIREGATAPICKEQFWLAPERVWIAQSVSRFDKGRYRIDPHLLP